MKILFVINDAPYGSEKAYNPMRLAIELQKENIEVRIFLMGDSVTCALPNQLTPQGYYNIERMFNLFIKKGGQVKACGTCIDARGVKELSLTKGIEIGSMNQLATWVVESDKVLTF